MRVIRKVKAFLNIDREMKGMLVEAYLYLGWARFLKLLPFSKVVPSLGTKMVETSHTPNLEDKPTLRKVSNAVHMMSNYTFWESQCLVKAIAAMKMLEKRNINSTLYLGTGKDDKGQFVAHAWLRSGPFYITGAEGMERFTVIAKFAKVLTSEKLEGESHESLN
ncbi:lasso peptide biosynthesis B2 protein [Halalkalibacter alkalisediminis]|uniref:Lasso peptide biosynthesis B2 protein n=1 Tax=Halalkalibacter alkalisediminis TaxID=935616 RepID=A0ABV6NH38_9BACI|nr:lasso peptide biosynthesis B2 protein [Halalkalibacter alkalisediminis]